MSEVQSEYGVRDTLTDEMYVDFPAYTAWVKTKEKVQAELKMDSDTFDALIDMAVCAGNVVDLFKKQFLGKDIPLQRFASAISGLRYAVRNLDDALFTENLRPIARIDVNLRLYHAALGKFGESAELLEEVGKQARGDSDPVNIVGELGDDQFYTAMALDSLGVLLNEVLDRNRDKLEVRYPEGFSLAASDARNVEAERAALQGTPGMEQVGSSFRPAR